MSVLRFITIGLLLGISIASAPVSPCRAEVKDFHPDHRSTAGQCSAGGLTNISCGGSISVDLTGAGGQFDGAGLGTGEFADLEAQVKCEEMATMVLLHSRFGCYECKPKAPCELKNKGFGGNPATKTKMKCTKFGQAVFCECTIEYKGEARFTVGCEACPDGSAGHCPAPR